MGCVSVCADSHECDDGNERDEAARESNPLPLSPAQRADYFAAIEKGLEDCRLGREISWEELDRRICKKFGLPSA